ncbi:site-specific integrase [Psychrobacillus sp. FSL K6-4615]|uniref:tyrosine-type recombinase/integrase n=1 Tax=Psychrobacillus sp. FSL K6-4615 TaxID=2921551 RepID=UPI0030F85141
MSINKKTNMSIEEICTQLGISETAFLKFLETSNDEFSSVQKPIENNKTVLFVIDKYLEHLKTLVNINKRSKETAKTYNNFLLRVKSHISINYPSLKINEFNEVILNEIITKDNLENKEYSVRTINKYNAIIKSLLKFTYHMDFSNKDFRHKFTIEKTSLIPRYIKEEDIPKVLEATKKLSKPIRCRAIIMFLLLTGCRVSEISIVKVKDFDIENNLIYILGKGNKKRIVPMFPQLKDEILYYLQNSGMKEWDPQCEGYLFARDENLIRNRNFPIRTIQNTVDRIRDHLPELTYITSHSFRHTFAVYCLKIGVKEHLLTEILGHTDPKTTMTYTKLRGEDLRDAIMNKFPFPFEKLLNAINGD